MTRRTFSVGVTVLVLVVAASGGLRNAIADEPASPAWAKKTLPWRPDLLDPGRGWWCSDVYCQRKKDDCMPTDAPCARRARAWSYTRYSRTSHIWVASAHPTRTECEGMREAEMEMGHAIGVSPCVSVGDKRPSRSKLPPGIGWWCHHFKVSGTAIEVTNCMRTEIECEDASANMMEKPQNRLEVTAGCVRSPIAWMSEAPGDDPSEPLQSFHATESDCLKHGLSDTCKQVK